MLFVNLTFGRRSQSVLVDFSISPLNLVSVDLCRSLSISVDLCRSLSISVDLCRSWSTILSISFLFLFQIVKDGKVWYYVNGADVQESNWMRYVNCSRVEEEQNLVAYQYRGEIFYRAYKDIQPGSELLLVSSIFPISLPYVRSLVYLPGVRECNLGLILLYYTGSELLVWYGEQYAQHLGINLDGVTTEPTKTVNGGKMVNR